MNEVYLLGRVIEIGEFKFIYGGNLLHKSIIELVIETVSGTRIVCRGYDDVADRIFREEFGVVLIFGRLKSKGYVEVVSVEKLGRRDMEE